MLEYRGIFLLHKALFIPLKVTLTNSHVHFLETVGYFQTMLFLCRFSILFRTASRSRSRQLQSESRTLWRFASNPRIFVPRYSALRHAASVQSVVRFPASLSGPASDRNLLNLADRGRSTCSGACTYSR